MFYSCWIFISVHEYLCTMYMYYILYLLNKLYFTLTFISQFKKLYAGFRIKVYSLKGTVSVISSNPLCKDGNVRCTTVPLKDLSYQALNWKAMFIILWNLLSLIVISLLAKLRISIAENYIRIIKLKTLNPWKKINIFQIIDQKKVFKYSSIQ